MHEQWLAHCGGAWEFAEELAQSLGLQDWAGFGSDALACIGHAEAIGAATAIEATLVIEKLEALAAAINAFEYGAGALANAANTQPFDRN